MRQRHAWLAGVLALLLLGGCGPQKPEDALIGKWKVVGAEHEGKYVPVEDRAALAALPGAARLTTQGFEFNRAGDYLSGESRGRWKLLDAGMYEVSYDVHGKQDFKVQITFERKGRQLRIRRPGGKLWIVLKKA